MCIRDSRETAEQTLAETEQKLALAESAIAILQKTAPVPKTKFGKTDKPRLSKTQAEKMEACRERWERYCEEIVQWDRALSEHTAEKARICALQEDVYKRQELRSACAGAVCYHFQMVPKLAERRIRPNGAL